jgi:hypothetical protein
MARAVLVAWRVFVGRGFQFTLNELKGHDVERKSEGLQPLKFETR